MLALVQVLSLAIAPAAVPAPPKVDDAPGAAIDWQAPPGCPTQPEVERAVAELAGRIPRPDELTATALVERRETQWSLTLTIASEGTDHRQVLHAEDCDSLATAAALVVAVLLDPLATATASPPAPTPAPRPEPTPEPAARAAPTRAAPRWGLGMQLLGGGEYVAIPRGGGGASLALVATRGRFELRIAGSYWAPRRTGNGAEPGASVQLGAAAVEGCFVPSSGTVDFPVCASVEAGAVRARGVDVDNARPALVPWVAAGLGPGLRWWVRPRFALAATAQLVVPLAQTQLKLGAVSDGRVIHESAPAGFRGLLGLAFRFSGAP